MIIKTAQELHLLTSSYDASNDFRAITADIELQTEAVVKFIGNVTYNHVKSLYDKAGKSDQEQKLIKMVQRPIALLATLEYFKGNTVGHSDTGRVVNVDKDNGQVAYEWMIRADDKARQNKAYLAIDQLLRYLIDVQEQTFIESEQYKSISGLFVSNIDEFQEYFSIDDSYRFFFTLLPLLRNTQNSVIKPILGNRFEEIAKEETEEAKEIKAICRNIIVLRSVSQALYRFSPMLFPEGLLAQVVSNNQKLAIADKEKLSKLEQSLMTEANDMLAVLKRTLKTQKEVFLIPENSSDNKFFRT